MQGLYRRMTRFTAPAFTGILLSALTGLSLAESKPATSTDVLAASCANCHGTTGRYASAIPPIGGRDYEDLREQLLGFKRGERSATVMDRIAAGYTEDQLEALARYFAEIED